MASVVHLSYPAQQVYAHDRERFVTAMFMPADRREDMLTLFAFYNEVARVRLSVKEAMAGMIRLQWWREVLAGQRDLEAASHPIASPLLAACRHHDLPFPLFDEILLAREWELTSDGFPDMQAAADHGRRTAGALLALTLHGLGVPDDELLLRARQTGAGVSLIGLARSLPHHLAQGWNSIPAPMAHLDNCADSLKQIAAAFVEAGIQALPPTQKCCRWAVPALASAIQARSHAAMMQKLGWNVLDMRVSLPRPSIPALAWAMLRGYV